MQEHVEMCTWLTQLTHDNGDLDSAQGFWKQMKANSKDISLLLKRMATSQQKNVSHCGDNFLYVSLFLLP